MENKQVINREAEVDLITSNYLTAYHLTKFNQEHDYDMETIRMCLATKYHIARKK